MEHKVKTPVEILGDKFPALRGDIEHVSRKWAKRTSKTNTQWPEEGTWDVERCGNQKGMIKNYKIKDRSSKRREKREKELEILALFEREGKEKRRAWRGDRRQMPVQLQEKAELEDPNEAPPPYLGEQSSKGLYPVISGTMNFEGEYNMEPMTKEEWVQREREKKQGMEEAARKAEEDLDGLSQRRKELEEEVNVVELLEWAKETMKVDKERERKGKNVRKVCEWGTEEDLSECGSETSQGKIEGKRVGWNREEKEREEICWEVPGGANRRRLEKPWMWKHPERYPEKNRIKGKMEEETEASSEDEGGQSVLGGRRKSMRKKHKPVKFPAEDRREKSVLPVILKGGRLQYIPWSGQDLPSLINELPNILDGAGRWIGQLEAGMMGKRMALGDVKALLTKVLGMDQMAEVMRRAGIPMAAYDPEVDGTLMDPYRQDIWQALRDTYPNRMDVKTLRGEPLGEEENAAVYVEKQLRRWRRDTERDILTDPLTNAMFRATILEGLPVPAKTRLEEVVGLDSKSYREFVDYVAHAVERHRKDEKNADKQLKEIQRKLLQAQLEEIKNKDKIKAKEDLAPRKIAPMMVEQKSEEKPAPIILGGSGDGGQPIITYNISAFPLSMNPEAYGLNYQNPYALQSQTDWNRNGKGQGGGRPPYQNQRGQVQVNHQTPRQGPLPGPPGVCWGCGEAGHIKRNCLRNSHRQGENQQQTSQQMIQVSPNSIPMFQGPANHQNSP
ncbi:uncharacterized protein [Scyliorhinus torazame]|uniref:uncharacterized protein n=1 Tax=Scyliorhinus torazame TaxID=75743 RepID=UPI003B5A7065